MNNEQTMKYQRQNRTKAHLRDALIELIKEKGYHSVTVKDIVDYAAYNRSTFYIHYTDKIELAEDLLVSMLQGLEASAGKPYVSGQKVYTAKLDAPSFNIVSYIYTNRNFFTLINYDDTLPGLHTRFPQTILIIYKKHFIFETINNIPVNMEYFKRYTAYGFYGLLQNWIQNGFKETPENFIQEVINLTKTHIYSFKYIDNTPT
ncbi:TetR/AcrR family transcriptional regulator [Niallia oryzisoli]|uniref:TetR/AcrR family transcriptional regulator n=1 Tax=Niallia oryzisoli TaxID=1737571 RepID=A0ABZ2CEX4_9BACI